MDRMAPLAMTLAQAGEILGVGRNAAPTMSVADAGAILGIGRNTAYSMAREGVIPTLRLGKLLRVPAVGLAQLLVKSGLRDRETA